MLFCSLLLPFSSQNVRIEPPPELMPDYPCFSNQPPEASPHSKNGRSGGRVSNELLEGISSGLDFPGALAFWTGDLPFSMTSRTWFPAFCRGCRSKRTNTMTTRTFHFLLAVTYRTILVCH